MGTPLQRANVSAQYCTSRAYKWDARYHIHKPRADGRETDMYMKKKIFAILNVRYGADSWTSVVGERGVPEFPFTRNCTRRRDRGTRKLVKRKRNDLFFLFQFIVRRKQLRRFRNPAGLTTRKSRVSGSLDYQKRQVSNVTDMFSAFLSRTIHGPNYVRFVLIGALVNVRVLRL